MLPHLLAGITTSLATATCTPTMTTAAAATIASGRNGTAYGLDKKATLTLTDASGQKVAPLKAGDKLTVVLADARYDCPANARIGDKNDPICNETRLLVKTADGIPGWLIVDFDGDNHPSIDGLHPLAG